MSALPEGEISPILARLPPGRHGLPREFVKENQLARITAGAVATFAEVGYEKATISLLVKAAGLSRRTFYAYFKSKEACFLGTLEAIGQHLDAVAADAGAGKRGVDRLEAELDAALATFEQNPDLGVLCLVEAPSGDGEVGTRYREVEAYLASRIEDARPSGKGTQVELTASLAGALALVTRDLRSGEVSSVDEIMQFLRATVLR